jgi:DMSO/TMAO reductase YedYZ heme-binding membrane subunit
MNQLWWYTARSAGLVSAALLAASVIWGLALSTAPRGARPRPAWRLDLHRYLGGLSVIFVAVHVLAIMADSYIGFGWVQVLVPFTSTWKPLAVALGVVAMYLLVAVELTSLARKRLPRRLWRRLHFMSFPLLVIAELHLFTAGTDAGARLVLGTTLVVNVVIAVLTTRRVIQARASAAALDRVPLASPQSVNA